MSYFHREWRFSAKWSFGPRREKRTKKDQKPSPNLKQMFGGHFVDRVSMRKRKDFVVNRVFLNQWIFPRVFSAAEIGVFASLLMNGSKIGDAEISSLEGRSGIA